MSSLLPDLVGVGVEEVHDAVEGQDVIVVLDSLAGELQFPALHDLLVAAVAGETDQNAEKVVPDGDVLTEEVGRVEGHEPDDGPEDPRLHPDDCCLDALVVLLGRVVSHPPDSILKV